MIATVDKPFNPLSGVAILKGNLCENGAVIKPLGGNQHDADAKMLPRFSFRIPQCEGGVEALCAYHTVRETSTGSEWLKATEAAALTMSRKAAQDSKSFGHYLLERLGDIFAKRREELKDQKFEFEAGGSSDGEKWLPIIASTSIEPVSRRFEELNAATDIVGKTRNLAA